jgi:DNA-binding CsgD family transcriptional regulator
MKAKKNKGGRPKESVSDKVDFTQVERLAELGHTDAEIGYILGYSKRTIENWKKDDEFIAHLKRGKAKADSKVIEALYKRAIGFEFEEETHEQVTANGKTTPAIHTKTVKKLIIPDTTAQIFWLKNRKPEQWRDKQEVQHSGEIKTISETTNFSLKSKGK